MPISGCHDLPLATFNLPSRNNLQNKPNSAAALCPAKRRFAFSPMGRHARLAAEIPDIFLPLARNENSGMTMIF